MDANFIAGFRRVTGRDPTPQDFANYQRRQQGKPSKEAERNNTIGQVGSAIGTLGGMYAANSLMGAGAATAGAGTAGAAGVGTTAATTTGATAAAPMMVPTAAPIATTGAASTTAAGTGAGTGTGAGAGLGMAGAGAVAGGVVGAALLGKGLYDTYQGDDTSGGVDWASRAQAAFSTMGGSELARLGFAAGKSEEQKKRDDIRSNLQQLGLADSNYNINGVDIGKDGGFRYEDGRRSYDVTGEGEEQTAEQGQAVGKLNAAGLIASRGDDEQGNQATGMLYNALDKGGEDGITDQEIKGVYDQLGGYSDVMEAMAMMAERGMISEEEARAGQNALNQIYAGEQQQQKDPSQEERQRIRDEVAQKLLAGI